MKMKLGLIYFACIFFTVLGYSSDPSFNLKYPPVNNLDEFCDPEPCQKEKTGKHGAGTHGPLIAVTGGKAWKEDTEFKWLGLAAAMNDDDHIKGQYSFDNVPPHNPVQYIHPYDGLTNVGEGDENFFSDEYIGIINVVFGRLSSRPYNNQNAITEVDTIHANSHVDGRALSDNSAIITPEYIARATVGFDCDCDDNDDGAPEEEGGINTPIPGLSPVNGSYGCIPGDSHEASLVTDGPYSQVYWYVKAPWEISHYGTNVEIDEGDETTTEASLTYTFPSGAMHTGEFTITAYIYRADLSVYEESYTVNVTLD